MRPLKSQNSRILAIANTLRRAIESREFEEARRKIESLREYFIYLRTKGTLSELFSELAFCILAANFSASKSAVIQAELGSKLLSMGERELAEALRALGHRYPEARARYIVMAREKLPQIASLIRSNATTGYLRDWLYNNLQGVGMKVASHFLRNTGRFDVAILDFHILDFLSRHGVVERPKTLTRRKYLTIESVVFEISRFVGVQPGILDLYMWYMETGEIVK